MAAEISKEDVIEYISNMTVLELSEFVKELEDKGLRDKYKVIVGGSRTSDEWADEIGADGWADDAIEAVSLVDKLLNVN